MEWDISRVEFELKESNRRNTSNINEGRIKILQKLLENEENIIFSGSGLLENIDSLIVCTSKRIIIIIGKKEYTEEEMKNIAIPIIDTKVISNKKGFGTRTLRIGYEEEVYVISTMGSPSANLMEYTINKIKEKYRESNKVKSEDSIKKIKKLKNLVDIEAITEEEYVKKKEELLNKI